MNELSQLLASSFLGNSVLRWALALFAFLVTFTVLPLLRGYIATLRKRHAGVRHATAVELASLLADKTQTWFLWAFAVWFATVRVLIIPERVETAFNRVMIVLLALQLGIWLSAAVSFRLHHRRGATLEADPTGALTIINFVAAIVIWSLVTLLALDNLGVNITALVAGLGIGGIAVALAVQNILGDLFASLSIVLDKPFAVGDFIVVDGLRGVVERVGIKTTRVRSLDGELLVFPNSDLMKSRIRNFRQMDERRVLFTVGVTYQTTPEKVRAIPGWLREAVQAQAKTRFDRAHFKEYGDSALVFEIVYYVLDRDYNPYMDVQQAINLAIFDRFAREGVEFAYPTRTLHVQTGPAVAAE
jgi:small-conductance mechanosensitive channel